MTKRFTNVDVALPNLAYDLSSGAASEVGSRLGERTKELLHQQIILTEPWQREVLTPYRNVNIAAQIAETMWVLSGRSDVEFLTPYLPRAADFSDDGVVWRGGYGPRLRAWGDTEFQIDQVRHILEVLSEDRSSRRAVVSIYDPAVDSAPGKDIPCNDFLSFISRDGALHLSVFVRSNDLIWGWSGINAFEWSALQEIIAGFLGLQVGSLVFNTTSLHIYDRHWDKARKISAARLFARPDYADSPRFDAQAARQGVKFEHPINVLDEMITRWFDIEARLRTGGFLDGEDTQIISGFPEPMLRSWLQVLAWYWSGDVRFLKPIEGTRLDAATQTMPASIRAQITGRKVEPVEIVITPDLRAFEKHGWLVSGPSSEFAVGGTVNVQPITYRDTTGVDKPLAHKMTFIQEVADLHAEKSAAYGDSWKKRGELFSIVPNIARKIDRLGSGKDTADETSADTAIDLLVYLIKYRLWLSSEDLAYATHPFPATSDENDTLHRVLQHLGTITTMEVQDTTPLYIQHLTNGFDALAAHVTDNPRGGGISERVRITEAMIMNAFPLARRLWEQENKPDFQNPYRNIDA